MARRTVVDQRRDAASVAVGIREICRRRGARAAGRRRHRANAGSVRSAIASAAPAGDGASQLGRVPKAANGASGSMSTLPPRKRTPSRTVGISQKCKEGTFGQALLYFSETDGNANCAGRRLAARGGIGSKISGGEAIEAFPLSRRAVLDFFRVRCSAKRSGDPIVAGKRPNCYAINYPELQAWIEIAHRPLIEVNDAARR